MSNTQQHHKKAGKGTMLALFAVVSILCIFLFTACGEAENTGSSVTEIPAQATATPGPTEIPVNKEGTTIKTRFIPPDGYTRVETEEGSFAAYLQNFSLKAYGENAYYYDDTINETADVAGVFNQDTSRWQQCADSYMRMRAEYLFDKGEYDKISFNFTNGFACDFSKWRQGQRVQVDGSKCSWVKKSEPSTTHETLDSYMDFVYQYANTESLQNQLTPVSAADVQIGDAFIITSYQMDAELGHAVFVVDMAVNEAGEKLYLIAEGTTPASQVYVVASETSPYGMWHKLGEDGTLSIAKTTYDEETDTYKQKVWECPGIYIRRFAD